MFVERRWKSPQDAGDRTGGSAFAKHPYTTWSDETLNGPGVVASGGDGKEWARRLGEWYPATDVLQL